ncbi:L-lactate dehydrogenase [Teratosphaeria destructans]|uniref:L-lactate dehydrogenase n=1 Tax=Teratosphaeria destructans TaxID=418781 RepID=A0A9W7T0L8_9PEZI|nr:L-lactate dehydrogenase [Teratosphaeria destructans]
MTTNPKLTSKIAVVGCGDVGSTIAYSLILNPVAGDVLLIDPKTDVRDAQAQDLSDATYHGDTSTKIRSAEHQEAGQCDIIILTAGAAQKKGESRTDLIGKNLKILKSAIEECKPFKDDAILLIVANPVDILTYFAQRYSGLKKSQVFGAGTFLDSARLKGILASQSGVAASSIEAYVLGEHGDSQFVAWSHASIGGVPLANVLEKGQIDRGAVAEDTKKKAGAIMEAKGATNYGIGGVAASIYQRNIRPVSFWQDDLSVCLSMPAVLGREGIVRSMPLELTKEERNNLESSAGSLRDLIKDAEKQ